MRKILRHITAILIICILSATSSILYAQGPGGVPDDPSIDNTNGAVGHPVGGGAPIGTGACILFGLAVTYGAISFIQLRKKKEQQLPDQFSD
jgi:hypothetical protein